MSGELFAFLTTLCWSVGIFPFTEASIRMGANTVNHIRLLFAFIVLSVILIVFFSHSFTSIFLLPSLEEWLWLGLSGIIGLSFGDYFGFTSFTIVGARTGSLFMTLAPAAALITSYLFLEELINLIGMMGIFITIFGVGWLTLNRKHLSQTKQSKQTHLKGVLFGLLAAICQGVGLVIARKGLSLEGDGLSPLHGTWIRMTIGTAGIFLFTFLKGKLGLILRPVFKNTNNGVPFAVAGTLLGPVAGVSFSMYAVNLINASVAQTIFSLVPVFAIPVSFLFYRDKVTFASILGAIIAVSGVVMLIWRKEILELLIN